MMNTRTIQQERRYTMALGYAWGRKDGAAFSTESGKRARVTSALDFATWYAATSEEDGTNLEQAWEIFTQVSPSKQRDFAEIVKTLPYTGRQGTHG